MPFPGGPAAIGSLLLATGGLVLIVIVIGVLLSRRQPAPDMARTKSFTNLMTVKCESCGTQNPDDVDVCLVCSRPLSVPARLLRPDGPPTVLGELTLIGRSPDCHIILKGDIYVSRYHAKIERQHDRFIITNLSQRNFTKLNGQYLRQPTVLSDDDQIQVGKTILTAELNHIPQEAAQAVEGVLVGQTGQPYILGASTTLGRAPDCDYPLDQDYISRHHAHIERQGNEYIVTDNDSDNGTYVNREPVTHPRTLQSGDQLSLGMTTLTFQLQRQIAPDSDAIPYSAKDLSVQEVKRYGRIEYSSPMDLHRSYPLRVGLLTDRMPSQYSPDARVRWTTIPLMPVQKDPLIVIRVSSNYYQVEPAYREVVVRPFDNIYTDFSIIPMSIPHTPGGETDLFVDLEYQGNIVKRINVNTTIQEQFGIGPVQIPHDYWKYIAVIAAVIGLIDAAASLLNFGTNLKGIALFTMVGGFIVVIALLAVCPLMFRRAAKKLERAV